MRLQTNYNISPLSFLPQNLSLLFQMHALFSHCHSIYLHMDPPHAHTLYVLCIPKYDVFTLYNECHLNTCLQSCGLAVDNEFVCSFLGKPISLMPGFSQLPIVLSVELRSYQLFPLLLGISTSPSSLFRLCIMLVKLYS